MRDDGFSWGVRDEDKVKLESEQCSVSNRPLIVVVVVILFQESYISDCADTAALLLIKL